jgi:hypothetical protein
MTEQPWYVCDWFKGFNEDEPMSYEEICRVMRQLTKTTREVSFNEWIRDELC